MSAVDGEGVPVATPPDPAPAPRAEPAPPPRRRRSGLRSTIEWVVIIAIALMGAVVIRTALLQAFFIPSLSMDPTLKIHDRILVNKLSYDLHGVHRGDIVVFRRGPNMVGTEGEIKDLVKRIIGLPGETISSGPAGQVEVDGRPLAEPYLRRGLSPGPPIGRAPDCLPSSPPDACTIPPGSYFVMGDNRGNSADSRVFGPIAKGLIVGRAFVIIWPIPDLRFL